MDVLRLSVDVLAAFIWQLRFKDYILPYHPLLRFDNTIFTGFKAAFLGFERAKKVVKIVPWNERFFPRFCIRMLSNQPNLAVIPRKILLS